MQYLANEARQTPCQCIDSDNPFYNVRKDHLEDGLALESSQNDSGSSKTVEPVGSFPPGICSASGRGRRGRGPGRGILRSP